MRDKQYVDSSRGVFDCACVLKCRTAPQMPRGTAQPAPHGRLLQEAHGKVMLNIKGN